MANRVEVGATVCHPTGGYQGRSSGRQHVETGGSIWRERSGLLREEYP